MLYPTKEEKKSLLHSFTDFKYITEKNVRMVKRMMDLKTNDFLKLLLQKPHNTINHIMYTVRKEN